jgi:2-(1,2-epoxy-1,2-dihydrophenyl)acetyl-CoA isomerase
MCDVRIASEDAFFACAYGRIGASPDGGMTYFLPRVIGPSKAAELMLNDPNLTAEAALEQGLVSKVVPADQLLDAARAKAEKLAKMAPHYVRSVKSLAWQSLDNSLADHLQLERHGIADSMATEDLRNGVTAFFAGEEVTFEGR